MTTSRMLLRWCSAAAILLAALAVPPARAARMALVIGNDSYRTVTALRNARSDAATVARTLESMGFRTTLVRDADQLGMDETRRKFIDSLAAGDEVVVFYAGHGVQIAGNSHLLPVDVRGDGERELQQSSVSIQTVLDEILHRKARFTLLVIDACRDNPFGAGVPSTMARGLVPTAVGTGQMIIYSAGSGQKALDNLGADDHDPNGLFTRVFVGELARSDQPVDRVLRRVRDEVVRQARGVGHEQVPALYDQSLGDFYFRQTGTQVTDPVTGVRPDHAAPLGVEFVAGNGDAEMVALVSEVMGSDLQRSGRFRLLAVNEGRNVLPTRDLVVERATPARHSVNVTHVAREDGRIDIQVRVVEKPSSRYVGGWAFTAPHPKALRMVAHTAADRIFGAVTGTPGRFAQRMAKVTVNAGRRSLMISDSDGADPQMAMSSPRDIAMPTWSRERTSVSYVSFEYGAPAVIVHELTSGRRSRTGQEPAVLAACADELRSVRNRAPGVQEFWLNDDWATSASPACAAAMDTVFPKRP